MAMAGNHVVLMSIVLALNITQLTGLVSESGRVLTESNNVTEAIMHLDNDTVRVDPLDDFKKYKGGYDVRNKHYWSSTAFTGINGYAMAVIWLICGLGYVVFLLVTACCKTKRKLKKKSLSHKQCCIQPLILAIFFTFLAVTACGLVFGGNSKLYSRIRTVINVIIGAADEASDTIYNTSGALKQIKSSLGEVEGTSKATDFLTSTSQRLDTEAGLIETHASKNKILIDKGLKTVYTIATVMILLTLIVVIALLAFRILKFQKTLQVLIIICWIFTVACWLFFGIYFFLHNFAGDTCTALEGFQRNPYNNSLSPILPCDELLSAKSVLADVSAGIHDLVNKVNNDILTSYGNILQICNPFSPPPMYEYQPWNCPATSIKIGEIPKVLRMLACPDYDGEVCNGGILIPTSYYKSVEAYSTSIQTLLDAYPGMESLVGCQTVKDAFSEILHKHCKPLQRYMRIVWAASVFLSLVLVALLIIWIIGAYHEQNHHSLDGSVKPRYADTIECGTIKPAKDDPDPDPTSNQNS